MKARSSERGARKKEPLFVNGGKPLPYLNRTCSTFRAPRSAFRAAVLCALLPAFCAPVYASGEFDAFALQGVGARPAGMGGAFIGVADDIEAVYYNPAGLGNLKNSGMTAMYQTPTLETSRGFLGANKTWDHPDFPGSFALGWLRMQSTDIEVTDTDEHILGNSDLANDLVLLGAGVAPFEHIALGVTAKFIRFSFNGFSQSGFGMDAGVHGTYDWFRFGVVLSDLDGTTVKGDSIDSSVGEVSDKIPMRLRPGIAFVFSRPLNLPFDLTWATDELIKLQGAQETRLYTGGEIWLFDRHAALRGGFQEGSGPTLGAGLRLGKITFDYSYLFSLNLRDENRLGLTFKF
jgi:hypothetical protein